MNQTNMQRSRLPTLLSILALASVVACAASDDDAASPGATGRTVGPIHVTPGEHTTSIARVDVSATHAIEFFESSDGAVTVLEGYDIDRDQGSKLVGFARGDSYAALYARLAGERADDAVAARLRQADARPHPERARRSSDDELQPSVRAAAPSARIDKDARGDSLWFQREVCLVRRRSVTADRDHCDSSCLRDDEAGCKLTWNPQNYETADIALFNAHATAWAHIVATGWGCGFLELELCTEPYFKEMNVGPRGVSVIRNESDDGFATEVNGKSFGVHYLFWE